MWVILLLTGLTSLPSYASPGTNLIKGTGTLGGLIIGGFILWGVVMVAGTISGKLIERKEKKQSPPPRPSSREEGSSGWVDVRDKR